MGTLMGFSAGSVLLQLIRSQLNTSWCPKFFRGQGAFGVQYFSPLHDIALKRPGTGSLSDLEGYLSTFSLLNDAVFPFIESSLEHQHSQLDSLMRLLLVIAFSLFRRKLILFYKLLLYEDKLWMESKSLYIFNLHHAYARRHS